MIQPLNATCEQRSQTERRSGRLVGIDIARGVAILGMLITHVTEGSDIAGAFEVFAGRSMALFALLAGVSLALLSGGSQPVRGLALRQAMVRIAVRAALVFVVGLSLVPLSGLSVILPFYAVYFLIALAFLRMRPGLLACVAAVWAVAGPLLSFAIRRQMGWEWDSPLTDLHDGGVPLLRPGALLIDLIFTGAYPVACVMPLVLVGLALGRLDLRSTLIRWRLAVGGALLALLAYAGSWSILQFDSVRKALDAAAAQLVPGESNPIGAVLDEIIGTIPTNDARWLVVSAPHTGTPFEVVGAVGVALIVVAVAMMLADRWPRQTLPLAATGSMALTVYVAQVIAIGILGLDVLYDTPWISMFGFVAVTLVFSTWWRSRFGRGPLERVLNVTSTATSRRVP
jgi:uncharacterized membrane protein